MLLGCFSYDLELGSRPSLHLGDCERRLETLPSVELASCGSHGVEASSRGHLRCATIRSRLLFSTRRRFARYGKSDVACCFSFDWNDAKASTIVLLNDTPLSSGCRVHIGIAQLPVVLQHRVAFSPMAEQGRTLAGVGAHIECRTSEIWQTTNPEAFRTW